MGAAGDMLTAALYELLNKEEKEKFLYKMNHLGLKEVKVRALEDSKCGIAGTRMEVLVGGVEEDDLVTKEHHHGHGHHHDESHGHHHGHHHAGLHDIEEVIESLDVSARVKANVKKVYGLLAQAESRAHGVSMKEIHFHEVGTMDAVADITAVSQIVETLSEKYGGVEIFASPVQVGSGTVACAHGVLPVPAPATAYLIEGIPSYSTDIRGEMLTPTGAALIKTYVQEFGSMPLMKIEKIGYGMGRREFKAANCVRAMLGERTEGQKKDAVCVLTFNVDDMTGEEAGYALKKILKSGAKDACITPCIMKKNRPGLTFQVLCAPEDRDAVVHAVFRHTTTIGIRTAEETRETMDRFIRKDSTPAGEVRVKVSEGYGVKREKHEFDDLIALAEEKGLSVSDIRAMIQGK